MKPRMKKVSWAIALVMVALLSLTALTAASDIIWPWSSEPGVEPQLLLDAGNKTNRLDEGGDGIGELDAQAGIAEPSATGDIIAGQAELMVTELQPDDIGYIGPVPEAMQIDAPPTGEDQAETVDWEALIPEGDPDQRSLNADPNWSDFYYFHVAGSALRPRDSSVNWTTDGSGGCAVLSSGDTSVVFNVHLDIPNGARIDYLRLYYYDTSANDSYSWITRYNNTGSLTDLTTVKSTGTAGYGTTLSPLLGHIVDSTNFSYLLNWRPYQLGQTMRLCGFRVAYRLP